MINWTTKDLARRLAKTSIHASDLRVGDIAMSDDQPWGVDRIEERDGHIWIYDEDNNGWGCKPDAWVSIVARSSLIAVKARTQKAATR